MKFLVVYSWILYWFFMGGEKYWHKIKKKNH